MQRILFTGGGSAGHVIPNVALIQKLLDEGKVDVCYMGTDGIEKDIITPWKIPYCQIECPKLIRGGGFKGFWQNLKIPFALKRAVQSAKEGLKRIQPTVVFSKGGYVALPVVIAAKKLKIPCFAHESDLSVGLANKLSSRYCKRVFTSFPETAKRLKNGEFTGAPIRESLLHASRAIARQKYDIPSGKKVVLVFGGGSGSARINQAVREHIQTLTREYFVLHICGKGNLVNSRIQNYVQIEFAEDMGEVYALADVVVCRAGAGTLFELLALKKPALVIPLEGQTRGDQLQNADYFKHRGLCHVLHQNDLKALPQAIERTLLDDGLKARLTQSGFTCGNERILTALQEVGV
jgi:UDP-N-acetylglucosamine--N-acetylmuramyl-(pentapeptide) pyrophosphoryl-undecaprenol N-acetylglucosamine transferase